MEIIDIAQVVANALNDKKAKDIEILDIDEISSICSYFVICSCTSTVQVKACADEVEDKLEELGQSIVHREGYNAGDWVLLDLGSIIVHIMLEQTREFYSIERLWADAIQIEPKLK